MYMIMTPLDRVVKFRRPGTELRLVNDALHKLYECISEYDRVKKRPRKITGKHLGSITESCEFKITPNFGILRIL